MPTKTKIEWTDYSSNPVRFRAANGVVVPWACVKVSPGCAHCYAEGQSWRFFHSDYTAENMLDLTPVLDEKEIRALLTSQAIRGKCVFIGDMTDIFGEWVPDVMLSRLFAAFSMRPDVTFQVLTKRSHRMREYLTAWVPLRNVWLGVSAEDQQRADERIPDLLKTPAAVRFVSAEPLIGPVNLREMAHRDDWHVDALDTPDDQCRLHWVIVGGESGPGARPCDVAWVRSIVQQCQSASVPVFVKQLGAAPIWRLDDGTQVNSGYPASSARTCGGMLHPKGGNPSEWPEDLRVREFPQQVAR